MKNSTFKSILLLGNHGNLYLKELQNSTDLTINSLKFKKKDPFAVDMPHQFIFNNTPIDFNGKYVLEELAFALSVLLNHNSSFDDCLILGDPTELMYQAFCFAKNKQNPHLIRQEIQFEPKPSQDSYLFFYPSGMVAYNIRREISSLIYLLKKFKRNTFLIRNGDLSNSEILQNMLKKSKVSFDLNILEVNGIEKLISNQTEFTS